MSNNNNTKKYLFIDTNIYKSMDSKNINEMIENIAKEYIIVVPSIQIHEMKEHLADRYIQKNKIEKAIDIIANQYDNDKSYYNNKIKDDINKMKDMAKKLLDDILEYKKMEFDRLIECLQKGHIIEFSSENYVGAENRKITYRKPYNKDNLKEKENNHDYYDSLMWESMLYNKELNMQNLFISTEDKGFLNNDKNDIDELLKVEWKLIQKGELIFLNKNELLSEINKKNTKDTNIVYEIIEDKEDKIDNNSVSDKLINKENISELEYILNNNFKDYGDIAIRSISTISGIALLLSLILGIGNKK